MNEYDDIADCLEYIELSINELDLFTKEKVGWDVRIYGNGLIRTVLKLLAAGGHGIHVSEMRPDHLDRLDQCAVPYQYFENEERGTGDAMVWVRLDRSCNRSFTFTNVVQKAPAA